MEEQVEVLSKSTLSSEEFDPNQFEDDESDSQFSVTSGTSTSTDLSGSSSVWIYFDKDPAYEPGHNVCKKCAKKYKLSMSMLVL